VGARRDSGPYHPILRGAVLEPGQLGEFALRPTQGDVLAAFVPLRRWQRDLAQPGKINTLLLSSTTFPKDKVTLEDLGVKVRPLTDRNALWRERSAVLTDAARGQGAENRRSERASRVELHRQTRFGIGRSRSSLLYRDRLCSGATDSIQLNTGRRRTSAPSRRLGHAGVLLLGTDRQSDHAQGRFSAYAGCQTGLAVTATSAGNIPGIPKRRRSEIGTRRSQST